MSETKKPNRDPRITQSPIYKFAAEVNRDLATQFAESPKLVLSAAVLAFERLDVETQVALLADTRITLAKS